MLQNSFHQLYNPYQIKLPSNNDLHSSSNPKNQPNQSFEQEKQSDDKNNSSFSNYSFKFFEPLRKSIILENPEKQFSQTDRSKLNKIRKYSNDNELERKNNNYFLTDDFKAHDFRASTYSTSKSFINNSNFESTLNTSRIQCDQLQKQNQNLKKQNEELKSQLQVLKQKSEKNGIINKSVKSCRINEKKKEDKQQFILKSTYNELRQIQKKKCDDMLILYKQIIQKLQKRVEMLLNQNNHLKFSFQKYTQKIKQVDYLKSKTQKINQQYVLLQKIIKDDSQSWQNQKQIWLHQKEYYKQIIRKLEFQINLNSL